MTILASNYYAAPVHSALHIAAALVVLIPILTIVGMFIIEIVNKERASVARKRGLWIAGGSHLGFPDGHWELYRELTRPTLEQLTGRQPGAKEGTAKGIAVVTSFNDDRGIDAAAFNREAEEFEGYSSCGDSVTFDFDDLDTNQFD